MALLPARRVRHLKVADRCAKETAHGSIEPLNCACGVFQRVKEHQCGKRSASSLFRCSVYADDIPISAPAPIFASSTSMVTRTGWVAGLGAELMLARN